jgi:hypothetical protein
VVDHVRVSSEKCANPSYLAFCVLFAVGLSGALIGMLCGVLGSAMAYRVEALDPATTQLLYDLILFLFLIPWPPFMLCVFWYRGPFSYSGLVSFWVPGASFFVWVFVMAVVQIRGWRRVHHGPAEPPAERHEPKTAASPDIDSAEVPESAGV